jgi:hypothetical protein
MKNLLDDLKNRSVTTTGMNNKVKDKINKARCSYAHLKPQHLGG